LLVAKALGRRQQPYHAGEILFIGDDRFFNEGLGSTVIGRRNLLGEISDTFGDSGRGSLASPTFCGKLVVTARRTNDLGGSQRLMIALLVRV